MRIFPDREKRSVPYSDSHVTCSDNMLMLHSIPLRLEFQRAEADGFDERLGEKMHELRAFSARSITVMSSLDVRTCPP